MIFQAVGCFSMVYSGETQSLSDTIDQLTLMSDVRQSPIIALMNTLSYRR